MALFFTTKSWILAAALLFLFIFSQGLGEENIPETGQKFDPSQALSCFNDKHIYSSCEESCRLTESGNINVPRDYADQYCKGPCFAETSKVLSCLDDIFAKFKFYNEATIQDVQDTIRAGCGGGSGKGNFNVAEHIIAEENNADKAAGRMPFLLMLVILGCHFSLGMS